MLLQDIFNLYSLAALEFPESTKKWMPEWFTGHRAFEALKGSRVFKIFSKFGLNDFRESIASSQELEDFKDFILGQLSQLISKLSRLNSEEADRVEQVSYKLIKEVMKPELWKSDKHKLLTQVASEDKKFRIDAETSIIKAYNIIRNRANALKIEMPDITLTQEFKNYSKRGITTVVFSTKPEDIAGMASRSDWGSCQNLIDKEGGDPGLNMCVVGSVLSKFIGIIYITTGEEFKGRGEKMVARSLVRFVVDTKNNAPTIVVDKMYPGYNKTFSTLMMSALKSRTSIPVVDVNPLILRQVAEPQSQFARYKMPEEKIEGLRSHEKSYLDAPEFFGRDTAWVRRQEELKEESENSPTINPRRVIEEDGGDFINKITSYIFTLLLKSVYHPRAQKITFDLESMLVIKYNKMAESIKNHYKAGKPNLTPKFIKKVLHKTLNFSPDEIKDMFEMVAPDYVGSKIANELPKQVYTFIQKLISQDI